MKGNNVLSRQPRLTIGMPTAGDYDGVFFSVQCLRTLHQDVIDQIEIIVVDQQPDTEHGRTVKGFMGAVASGGDLAGARYIAKPDPIGPATTKNAVVEEASGEFVLCMDSHVILWPDSVRRLLEFYTQNPDCRDLLTGPMIYDDLRGFSTNFNDVWRGEMWGTWGTAWGCPCNGFIFSVIEGPPEQEGQIPGASLPGSAMCVSMVEQEIVTACPHCARTLPRLAFPGHERSLLMEGFRLLGDDHEGRPFPIWGMGMGMFTCRKSAWLGFNPLFRGFGAEEGYIHLKYRKAGHQALCLPWLRWVHRFGRPGGVPYPLNVWNKVRNYVIGHHELGLPLEPIFDHFVKPGRMPIAEWNLLITQPGNPVEWPPAQMATKPGGCGGCQPAADARQPTLEELYQAMARTPSDINEHVPRLRELADGCDTVVEFSGRTGVSTTALLAGQPKTLISIDVNDSPQARSLGRIAGKTTFMFQQGNSLKVDIPECDLLFIDTTHTAAHVWEELARHVPRVKKRIAFHDTQIFGEIGENGGPGLLVALRRFLKEFPEWTVLSHVQNNHGFTVISRDHFDKPLLPSTAKKIWNFAGALTRMASAKVKGSDLLVTEEVAQDRLDVCALCTLRNSDNCSVCGCFLTEGPQGLPGKALIKTEFCPVGKWQAVSD